MPNDINEKRIEEELNQNGYPIKYISKLELGYSFASKYYAVVQDGVKLLVRTHLSKKLFTQCKQIFQQGGKIQEPLNYIESSVPMAVFRWVDGETVADNLKTARADIYHKIKLGVQAADTLHRLQNCVLTEMECRAPLSLEVEHYVSLLREKKLNFPLKEEICHYAIDHIFSCDRVSLVHMDFHTQNLILSPNEKEIHIIDYENLTISDPWRDFTYFGIKPEDTETLFWYATILSYFDCHIPNEFWETVKLYTVIQLIRIILHEYEYSPEKASFVAEKISNTIQKWYSNSEWPLPPWMRRYDMHKNEIAEIIKNPTLELPAGYPHIQPESSRLSNPLRQ